MMWMGLGERAGRFDDESVIYRADDPEQKVAWRRLGSSYLVGTALAAVLIAGGGAVFGEGAAIVGVLVASVAFLVAYVIWRRRRNRRLTGSPTTWPS
jgi:Flp pilus assembly protein TadB